MSGDRRCRKSRPVPWGAEELAARQAATDLVNAHPALWPMLNELTLTYEHEGIRAGVNWAATLRLLKRRIAGAAIPSACGRRDTT
jgi:hypothetical protein